MCAKKIYKGGNTICRASKRFELRDFIIDNLLRMVDIFKVTSGNSKKLNFSY